MRLISIRPKSSSMHMLVGGADGSCVLGFLRCPRPPPHPQVARDSIHVGADQTCMPALLMSGPARPPPPFLAARHDHATAGDPSRSGTDSNNDGQHRPPRGPRPKRTLIESACSACRRRKSRVRPLPLIPARRPPS